MNFEERLKKEIHTKLIGKNIIYQREIDSTQEMAKQLLGKVEEGTIIIADKQTAGIGTHGRSWYTGEESLAFTIILYPDCQVEALEGFTYKIASYMIETIKELYGITLEIKLPNDIVWQKKKMAGILTQTNIEGKKVKNLLIGVGMNINGEKFPQELEKIATSLKKEFGVEGNKEQIIAKFLEKLENGTKSIFNR